MMAVHRRFVTATAMSTTPVMATVKAVRAVIPGRCHRICTWRALRGWFVQLALAATLVAMFVLCARRLHHATWSRFIIEALALPLCWLLGQVYVGLFVIGHDCGHGSFSRHRAINDLVGYLCTAPFAISFEGWRCSHNHHHAHTQQRGHDTDWAEQQRTAEELARSSVWQRLAYRVGYGSPVGLLVGIWVGHLRRNVIPWGYPQVAVRSPQARRVWLGTALAIGWVAALVIELSRIGGSWLVWHAYLLPLVFGGISGSLLTFMHHSRPGALVLDGHAWTPDLGQVAATFEVRFPRWLEWLWKDINLHLPHHVAPRIPWYHLRQASVAVQSALPDQVHVHLPFRWATLWGCWMQPCLVEADGSGLYRMGGAVETQAAMFSSPGNG